MGYAKSPPSAKEVWARWLEVNLGLNELPISQAAKLVAAIREQLRFWPTPTPDESDRA